jgi:hypothetical protein
LEACVDTPHEYGAAKKEGISPAFVSEIVGRLLSIHRSDICDLLSRIPTAWPITEAELETVGFFLERRAPAVAARLEERFRGTP